MKQALYIDCCIRGDDSRTKQLAEAFLAALPDAYEVTRLDLQAENLRYFTQDYLQERQELLDEKNFSHPRFRYAHQFAQADLVIVAAPFWDLAFPALLKVYIEQISVDGITFGTGESGLVGLCKAEKLVFLTTRGGFYSDDPMEMGSRYLDALHDFFGIGSYDCIGADGMDIAGFDGVGSLQEAKDRAKALAASLYGAFLKFSGKG